MSQTMLKVTLLVENVEMTIHEVTKIAYRAIYMKLICVCKLHV